MTELTLDFHHDDQIILPQLWKSFFEKAQSLKSLTLSRSFNASLDFSGFQIFPECFQYMKVLTSLRVHLSISAQLDYDEVFFIGFLFDSLKSLPQLKKLEFTIDGSYISKDNQIKRLAEVLEYLTNLHTLDLNILHLELSSEAVISLAKNLKNLSCLKRLKLKFTENRNYHLTYSAIQTFAKSLTHLPLKYFDLDLSDKPMTLSYLIPKRKVPFLSILSSLKDLASLHLDLSAFPPGKWKRFDLNPKSLRKLTSLSVGIGYFNCTQNYKGLSEFMLCLKVMPSLTTLKLSGAIVCDQELDLFLKNLDGCPNLHRLELTFQNSGQLSGKPLDSLQAALVKLTKLEYIEVNLWKSYGYTDNIVSKLLGGLIVLKRLKELVVNFERTQLLFRIPAFQESVQKLENCKYLTKIEINCVRYL